ncbi:MAG TPA: hypothetical protein VF692_12380 [Pyrinomonadaceae bacterium]
MKFRTLILFAIIIFFGSFIKASAQAADTVLGQFTNSATESFAGGVSGDGRFVVFESRGNLATENPRNADNNREIFLFDYAQRRIFQITDTKSLLIDATKAPTFDNIRVEIVNLRPVISNDGRWIAFGSNATTSVPGNPNTTTPANFDANSFTIVSGTTSTNPLTADGNTELWLYQIPAATAVDLSAGSELPLTELTGGEFIRATNTPASRLPIAATTTTGAFIADDNHDPSINDNGSVVAFVSTQDLAFNGTAGTPSNDEIYVFLRARGLLRITDTPPGTAGAPIYNVAPTISGSGTRVAFASNGNNPIRGGAAGANNADGNEEIFYADLVTSATEMTTIASGKQVTATTQANPGDLVNLWTYGRRMSRDGRYIAFDSYADLASGGANQNSFALYVYDTNTNTFRQIGPRSDADAAATGGDIARYPTFSVDVDSAGVAQTALVFTTRLNITSAGTVPATQSDGLNPNAARPAQIYSYLLGVSPGATAAGFVRLTNLPTPNSFLASIQPIASNSVRRIVFNLALTEPGTGNPDLFSEVFYLIKPNAVSQPAAATASLATGASRIPVTASPVPTPSASPSPTPQTPSAVQGLAPGMLALITLSSQAPVITTARTAVGSLQRSFTLPIELSGVTVTINGAAAGLRSVNGREIEFVVPPAIPVSATGTTYPVIINNNGAVVKGEVFIVPARPDVFTTLPVPGPGGRARIFNATNAVQTREPFSINTFRRRGSRRVPTVLRLYLTGVNNLAAANFRIRIGNTEVPASQITTGAVLIEPGVYAVDFTLSTALANRTDQPVIVSVIVNNVEYFARLGDTAPRISIL